MVRMILVAAVALLGAVAAFKSGAPDSEQVCRTMVPEHMAEIQPLSSFPYKVTVDPTSIRPGQSVTLKISGSDDNPIRGFLVQARVGGTPIGQFEAGPQVQAIDCLQGAKNAATHSNGEKKPEVKLVWTAPKDLQESIKFRVTVVKKGDVYWVGYETRPISVSAS
ncbi:putative defense protein 3 [Bacillus rossius redtenbacheri]|uniref:putative defense protein 3 n=1 Tax=Bacillus rossius redtenbacheri TaxID=93214 RepID=UPI002FDD7F49